MDRVELDIPRRSQTLQAFVGNGGRLAAVLPIHVPRALLRAFGFQPVEVWGPPGIDPNPAAAHLQPYICSIARNALAFLLQGGLDRCDLIVVPHTCDSLQGLGSLLIDFIHPPQPVLTLYLPRARRPVDLNFLAAELRHFSRQLEAFTGLHPPDEAILACAQREEQADALLADLHRQRAGLAFSQIDFYRLVRSREYLPAEDFIALADRALARFDPRRAPQGIPLLISGILPEPMRLLEALESLGARIAADDLACTGRRLVSPGTSADPYLRIAESLQSAPPCSTRGDSLSARSAHLLRLAADGGARGAVFYTVKFCEPELFDLPALRQELETHGLRSLSLEADVSAPSGDPLSHATLTRLEAFLEGLS